MESIIQSFIEYGYVGIFFLMALESSLFPVPSELVMIPAGVFASRGDLSLTYAVLAGWFGSLLGASVNYCLGYFVGRPFIVKYGKYFLIREEKYNEAEMLFSRNAALYTFLGRFIPVIRHLISIPAGVFKMWILPFGLLTLIGATLWSLILALLGYYFGDPIITIVRHYSHEASILAVILILAGGIWFVRKK